MSLYMVLCLTAVVGHIVTALDVKCGDVIGNTTADSFGVPTNFKAGKNCNVTVMRSKEDLNTTVQLSNVHLAPGDAFLVYDGDKMLLANFTARLVARQILVGFQQNTTFVFIPSAVKSQSSWMVNYDTKECDVNIENSWTTSFSSPTYVKESSKLPLQCTYTVTSFQPTDYIAAAALTAFSLTGDSSLEVYGVQGNSNKTIIFSPGSALTDFFADGPSPLVLTLTIKDVSTLQNFSLVVESVLQECSGPVSVKGSLEVNKAFPSLVSSPGRLASCRWLLSSESPLLHAKVTNLQLAPGGGEDSLAFRSGRSIKAEVLDILSKDVNDYLVVTSGNTLVVEFTMGSSSKTTRTLNVTFIAADFGGRLEGEGYLSTTGAAKEKEEYFALTASTGQWVDVTRMTKLTNGSSVLFHDGLQLSSPVLTKWSSDDEDLSPVTGHKQMLVVVSNLAAGEKFNASFTSVPGGCDTLTSAAAGEMKFSAASALVKVKVQTCTWTVAPLDTEGTVILRLSSVNLRMNESLTVTQGLTSSSQVLAKFTGPYAGGAPLPQVYISASERFRVSFTRVAAASPFTGAIVQYRTMPQDSVCGGQLAEPLGLIQTPNYPNQYPLNAMCDWTVSSTKDLAASASSLLLLSFSSLSLAQSHSISVLRTEKNQTEVARYGGMVASNLPDDIILPRAPELTVAFSSQPGPSPSLSGSINDVAGGASLNYWILECGGNLTAADGSFTSPEFSKPPTKSAFCVWILNVGQVNETDKSTNIVSFNISAVGKDAKSLIQYLKIYDGPSLRSPFLPLNAKASNLSRFDSIIVLFNFTFDSSSKPDVRLNFTYKTKNCNTSEQCDNGICMHPDWICNGYDDCGDNSDERDCVIPGPTPKPPKPAPPQSYSGWVKSGWVPGCLFIGLFVGIALVLLTPRVIRKLRGVRPGSYDRMDSPALA